MTIVSPPLAATQYSLNSLKISGPCGRLLCCLGYEYDFYQCEKRNLPEEGMRFSINGEHYVITEINVLVKTIRLQGASGRLVTLPFDLFHLGPDGKWSLDQNLARELNFHA